MSAINTVLCDWCGADLEPKSGEKVYHLEMNDCPLVLPSAKPGEWRLGGRKHFCGLSCLGNWVEEEDLGHRLKGFRFVEALPARVEARGD